MVFVFFFYSFISFCNECSGSYGDELIIIVVFGHELYCGSTGESPHDYDHEIIRAPLCRIP